MKLFDCSLFKLSINICGISIGGRAAGCLGEFEAGPAKESERLFEAPRTQYPTQPRGARDPSFSSPYYLYHYYIYLSFSSDSGYQQN